MTENFSHFEAKKGLFLGRDHKALNAILTSFPCPDGF
jgi:hypothetical protein